MISELFPVYFSIMSQGSEGAGKQLANIEILYCAPFYHKSPQTPDYFLSCHTITPPTHPSTTSMIDHSFWFLSFPLIFSLYYCLLPKNSMATINWGLMVLSCWHRSLLMHHYPRVSGEVATPTNTNSCVKGSS